MARRGDDDVFEDERAEDRFGLRVRDPATVDDRLRDDGRRGDVDDTGDQQRLQGRPAEEDAQRDASAEVQQEVDRARLGYPLPVVQ